MSKLSNALLLVMVFISILIIFWYLYGLWVAFQMYEPVVAYMECDKGLWLNAEQGKVKIASNKTPLHAIFCWHSHWWDHFGTK